MAEYILAFDQGTTSSRSILFDLEGAIISSAQEEFPQIYPRSGWVEQDGEEIFRSQYETAKRVIHDSGISIEEIRTLGITNQRETSLIWERESGKPVANAIVWQCRRSSAICTRLREQGLEAEVQKRTGLVIDPYFSASKILWYFENIPGLAERAAKGEVLFGTVDSWLLHRFCGVHRTDISNASRTMLYNIHKLDWDDELLKNLGIPRKMLPEVFPSASDFGTVKKHFFGREIPICGVAGDQHAALFGQCCFTKGEVKNTYGTGCFILMNTGVDAPLSENKLLTTVAWDVGEGPVYALEGSIFVAGAALQWLRDELGIIASAAESEELARSVKDSGGAYMVPAFVGLGAPYWDSEVRGSILGLSRGSSRAELVRAALESIAFQTADLVAAMKEDTGAEIKTLRADGGASANDFLLEFQADILGVEVERPLVSETTAFGAASLAGLQSGLFSDIEEIKKKRRVEKVFSSRFSTEHRERLVRGWHRAVEAARCFRSEESD